MKKKQAAYPQKQQMNLYYLPDRTTRPATASLYILFALVVMLALGKFLVYDLWVEVEESREALRSVQTQVEQATAELANYEKVAEEYHRYAATEEEEKQISRMEILALLEEAVTSTARMDSVTITGESAVVRVSGVTLAQTAQIVNRLEASPLVARITVDTAATANGGSERVSAGILIQLQKEEVEGP